MLSGNRIVLRVLERDDLMLIHKWQNDQEIMRLARGMPDNSITTEALAAEFEKNLKGEDADTRRLGIEEKSSWKLIGWYSISLNTWAKRHTSADIGVAIGEGPRAERVRH